MADLGLIVDGPSSTQSDPTGLHKAVVQCCGSAASGASEGTRKRAAPLGVGCNRLLDADFSQYPLLHVPALMP
jgi:hypothetical protein